MRLSVPQTEAADEGIGIVTGPAAFRQFLQVYDISAAYDCILGLGSGDQSLDNVGHELAPAFLTEVVEALGTDVIFVSTLFVRQGAQFHRLENSLRDHRLPTAPSQ